MNPNPLAESDKPTVLIVDDIPANLGVLVDYLEDHEYRVVVAQDGEEALQRARFARPDLILLDVMMPGMDGFETCRRLKAEDDVKEIPVIFMTALADTTDKVRGFEVGGVDYVTKPFQIEEVLARVNTHLALCAMRRKLAEQNERLQQEMAERKKAEQALLQSEKMASLGQLAAGVAHEINNPIAFVNANLGTLREYINGLLQLVTLYERGEILLDTDHELVAEIRDVRERLDLAFLREDAAHLLTESLDGVQRVRRIVQDLRDFAHVGQSERQPYNLHAGIDSALNILSSEISGKVDVRKEYGRLPDVDCVPAQINQVFMGLLMNAVQSVGQAGTIVIRTGLENGSARVEIEDNGCGIPAENLQHVFEPFFTTKPPGKGTGLGLSMCYGIVKQHGGRIDIDSEPGKGTRVTVRLATP